MLNMVANAIFEGASWDVVAFDQQEKLGLDIRLFGLVNRYNISYKH
jgi:D-lyxose ketol-isomerase